MTALPDIPRLYTALAECLAVLLFTPALAPRFSKAVTVGVTLLWAAVLSAFLGLTGDVPGGFWIPCMAAAICCTCSTAAAAAAPSSPVSSSSSSVVRSSSITFSSA